LAEEESLIRTAVTVYRLPLMLSIPTHQLLVLIFNSTDIVTVDGATGDTDGPRVGADVGADVGGDVGPADG
jgi:positive regulator of sigma E activity